MEEAGCSERAAAGFWGLEEAGCSERAAAGFWDLEEVGCSERAAVGFWDLEEVANWAVAARALAKEVAEKEATRAANGVRRLLRANA